MFYSERILTLRVEPDKVAGLSESGGATLAGGTQAAREKRRPAIVGYFKRPHGGGLRQPTGFGESGDFEPLVGLGLGNTVGFSAECRKAGRLVRRCLKRNHNVRLALAWPHPGQDHSTQLLLPSTREWAKLAYT